MKVLHVLLVEDDAIIGELLAEMLDEMGYHVCAIAATEADAVTAAARYRPDLIIADARLGNGSGISAVDEILRTAHVPYLFISGNISRLRRLGRARWRFGSLFVKLNSRAPFNVRSTSRRSS